MLFPSENMHPEFDRLVVRGYAELSPDSVCDRFEPGFVENAIPGRSVAFLVAIEAIRSSTRFVKWEPNDA
jgi:hypothetical protein